MEPKNRTTSESSEKNDFRTCVWRDGLTVTQVLVETFVDGGEGLQRPILTCLYNHYFKLMFSG